MQRRAGLLWRILAFPILGVLVYTACTPPEPPPPPPPEPAVIVRSWRPECPNHDTLAVFTDTLGNEQTIGDIAASGAISMIPEFHDCQRLVVLDSGQNQVFGPLIALFASIWLEPKNHQSRGSSPSDQPSMAAVTILNYDAIEYAPLQIKPGISCLYVYREAGEWKAKLRTVSAAGVPMSNDDEVCNQALAAGSGIPLAVRTAQLSAGAQVPGVTRWDWDAARGEHFISVRCGNTNSWCEVYPQGDLNPAASSSNSYPSLAAYSAKGWYDEQYLAVEVDGSLTPGPVMGTISPKPGLDTRSDTYYSSFKPVAAVALSGESEKYLDKFNFKAGPAPAGNTTIHLCKGTKDNCGIPDSATVNDCEQTKNLDGTTDEWWAKIGREPDWKYRCVIRRKHDGLTIPGTVRWRWVKDDEGMWIRCPGSCCQVT